MLFLKIYQDNKDSIYKVKQMSQKRIKAVETVKKFLRGDLLKKFIWFNVAGLNVRVVFYSLNRLSQISSDN